MRKQKRQFFWKLAITGLGFTVASLLSAYTPNKATPQTTETKCFNKSDRQDKDNNTEQENSCPKPKYPKLARCDSQFYENESALIEKSEALQTALDALQKEIAQNPNNTELYFCQASFAIYLQNLDLLETSLNKANELTTDSELKKAGYQRFLYHVWSLNFSNEPDKQLLVIRKLIELAPDNVIAAELNSNLGQFLSFHGDRIALSEVIKKQANAAGISWEDYEAGRVSVPLQPGYQAKIEQRQQELQLEAISAYQKAIALSSDNNIKAEYYQGLGTTLADLNQQDEAILAYRQAIALSTDRGFKINTHTIIGSQYQAREEWSNAEIAYREAIALIEQNPKISPDFVYPNPYTALSLVLEGQGKSQKAEAIFLQGINLQSDNLSKAISYHERGMLLQELGRHEQAIQNFRLASALDLEDLEVKAYSYMLTGESLEKLGRQDEAIVAYRQAIELEPDPYNKSHYLIRIGHILESQGKRQEALEAYREALKWLPEDEGIQENIRRIERDL